MKLNVHEFLERRRAEASVVLEIPDGDPIVIPPPDLWTVAMREVRVEVLRGRATLDDLGRVLLGDAEFDRWAEALEAMAPGSIPGDVLNAVWIDATKQQQGVTPGES